MSHNSTVGVCTTIKNVARTLDMRGIYTHPDAIVSLRSR